MPNHAPQRTSSGGAAVYGVNFSRLAGIKYKYDPQNFFRRNSNIPNDVMSARWWCSPSMLSGRQSSIVRVMLRPISPDSDRTRNA